MRSRSSTIFPLCAASTDGAVDGILVRDADGEEFPDASSFSPFGVLGRYGPNDATSSPPGTFVSFDLRNARFASALTE